MKLPFVSRAMHDEVVRALAASLEHEHEHCAVMRRQLADVSARYHALRQSGYQAPPDRGATPRVEVDEVTKAINTASRGDRQLRLEMWAQVARDRANGLSDDVIAKNVLLGRTSETLEEFVGS